ncbi:MAG: FAD-dependent oxidoreductase [Peptococcaceae bacterium]|nr:FAD-dependent oxidoreductase [Peptococcaceae bacterium]
MIPEELPVVLLNIDGHEVITDKGKTILEAALEAGIYIPNLCHHPDLKPIGVCRLCVVEIDGRQDISTACTTPAEEGMVVRTRTPGVDQIRRLAIELMLSIHPSDCSTCPKYGKCEFQSLTQLLGVNGARLRKRQKHFPVNTGNPLFLHDPGRCVLCGRCVRACQDLRGVRVLDYRKKDGEVYIGTVQDLPLADAGCRFCGACVEVCPTGALRDHEGLLMAGVTRKEALVPCRTTCPAGIDVPRYIRLIRENKPSQAAAVIREKVPFPVSLGYVCNHRCETACRRKEVNESVAIRELKRFAAEKDDGEWEKKSKKAPPTGKRVAVVGAGPAGLTAAYYLAKQGNSVTVYEELPLPGGMLRFGIPEYRLPPEVVAEEIKEIEDAGVEIRTNTRVDSIDALLEEGYNAVLVATGAHQGVKLPIPGADLEGVLVNIPFLRDVRLGRKVDVGERVVVLGGGNVAFDCARVARRLGAGEVRIVCLESREKMTASPEEIEQGEEEGIIIHPSRTFTGITGDRGHVTGVECLEVESFAFDEDGKAQISVVEGSAHVLPADTVIFAVGQRPRDVDRFGLAAGRGNTVLADPDTLAANREAVFAAGGVVTGTISVIEAIAAGRKAAVAIDRYLGGDGVIDEELAPVEDPGAWIGREEGFAGLRRCAPACAPAERRINNFDGVDPGYDEETALKESRRCLQCDLRLKISAVKFWADYFSRR